jgi:3-oxoacyl-[acyl-carrier-protein] synthase II
MLMPSSTAREIVITGVGVVSPIGVGLKPFWESLCQGTSGIRALDELGGAEGPLPIAARVTDFDGKQHVTPRKSLKVMSREIQFGFAASRMAVEQAGLEVPVVDPERWGVILGSDMLYSEPADMIDTYRECIVAGQFDFSRWGEAMQRLNPLWMLKYLPNMAACHVGIALDVRGPTNSIVQGETSSLQALIEACRTIERGAADIMVTGGSGSRISPVNGSFRDGRMFSSRIDDPAAASRPFDLLRDGSVNGEGAAALVLESRRHAEARQANILACVRGYSSTCEPRPGSVPPQGAAIRRGILAALEKAGMSASEVGHVNAHGISDVDQDIVEARAIAATLGSVPVTAPKSLFGNLGGGGGAVELVASVLALETGEIPPTRNYEHRDPDCPVTVVYGRPQRQTLSSAVVLNQTAYGHATAVVISRE